MNIKKPNQETTKEQSVIFSALADQTRLKLVKLLCRHSHRDALCVNALASLLGVTQSAISQHLRILKLIGLVNGERRGYYIHYYVNPDTVKHCQELISAALTIEESANGELCQNCNKGRKQNYAVEQLRGMTSVKKREIYDQ